MQIDPCNPQPEDLVHNGSCHPAHAALRKTLVLLKLSNVYFVVEGLCHWPSTYEKLQEDAEYSYVEHNCPTNFIPVELIAHEGNTDPHGVFEFVEAVWMTSEYEALRQAGSEADYLKEVFKL